MALLPPSGDTAVRGSAWTSDAQGKHQVANVPDPLVVWRAAETPILNEPNRPHGLVLPIQCRSSSRADESRSFAGAKRLRRPGPCRECGTARQPEEVTSQTFRSTCLTGLFMESEERVLTVLANAVRIRRESAFFRRRVRASDELAGSLAFERRER